MTREAAEILYDQTTGSHPAGRSAGQPARGAVLHRAPIELHVLPSKFGSVGGGDSDSGDGGAADADDSSWTEPARPCRGRHPRDDGPDRRLPRMQVLDQDGQTYRPVRYRDIASAAVDALQGRPVRRVLRQAGVPGPRRERHRLFRVGRGAGHARPAGGARQPAGRTSAGRRAPQPDLGLPAAEDSLAASASPSPRGAAGPFPPGRSSATPPSRTMGSRDTSVTSSERSPARQAAPPAARRDGLVHLRADRLPRRTSGPERRRARSRT